MVVSDHGGDGTGHGDTQPYINQTIFYQHQFGLKINTSSQAILL